MLNLKRWIPLVIVGAAAGGLTYMSNEDISMEGESAPAKIEVPPQGMEYRPPANFRNMFHIRKKEEMEIILPVETSSGTVRGSTQTARGQQPGAKPGQKQPAQKDVNIQGIIWDPISPIVSINGMLMKQGEKRNNIKVIRIFRDSALLEVDGKLIKKRVR